MEAVTRLFTTHPHSVDESYFQHMAFAAKFSGLLFLAGMVIMAWNTWRTISGPHSVAQTAPATA